MEGTRLSVAPYREIDTLNLRSLLWWGWLGAEGIECVIKSNRTQPTKYIIISDLYINSWPIIKPDFFSALVRKEEILIPRNPWFLKTPLRV